MNAFHQQVGGHQHLLAGLKLQHGAVVAYAFLCLGILEFYAFREVANQPELA